MPPLARVVDPPGVRCRGHKLTRRGALAGLRAAAGLSGGEQVGLGTVPMIALANASLKAKLPIS